MEDLVQALIISRLDYDFVIDYTPIIQNKPPTASAELCCTSGDVHSKKGTYNTNFVPAALSTCTFQITIQYPVSYIQCIEWNSSNVSKRSDRKIYTREHAPIWVQFTFEGTKKAYSNVMREIVQSIISQTVERVAEPH